ncbi:unnamed protein product [Trypanosoma congolense IL3000]|uniref:WGS project CAEQ00000000 data, annotated contig 723 n=1 Tax=Trypanosoma congolense (strain IL3000) TaxID=1068625 RepID=F9WI25_TRYCI|nr:unnamed protein product [Trypanosoma congolense IL3000]
MALEVRTTSALSHSEQLGSLPKCRGNGNEPDTSGIVAHLTGALLQVQAVSVDYESVHCALSRLEGKVEAVTSKLAAVSEGISAKEQRRERDITSLCDSCKGFRTHILSLEDQMNSLERDVVANKRSTSALAVDLHNLEEAFQFLRGNVKKLKDTLVNCVTNASDEWNEVCTQISMFSSFASMYRADKAVNTEGFVRVEHRLDACEQALSQVLGDGCNHKCMGITHKPVRSETVSDMELEAETIMKHHLQPSSERNVNVKGGEGLGAGQSASAANDKHALNPPEDRSGLWADGAPKNLIPTPLPSALDVVMSLLTTFDHRLQQVRDDVTEIRVSEKILTAQSAYMRVPDLVSSLEDCLTACSQAFVESKESISLCHEHIKCLEQHLSSKGAYQTLDEHRVSPNEGVANENSGGASMKEILERLKHNEHILSEVQLSLPAQKSDMNITYTKSEIDDRFANQWVSFVALLARKEDQDALEGKLANLSWTLLDNVTMRIDALSRELNRAINERARLTEVQEMLSNRVG